MKKIKAVAPKKPSIPNKPKTQLVNGYINQDGKWINPYLRSKPL